MSLARPGSNATGFTLFEYGISGKWLELLKQLAPAMTRVVVLRDTSTTTGVGQFAAIQAVASSFAVELRPLDVQDAGEIERSIGAFAGSAHGGLIVTSSPNAIINRDLIIALAARHRLPAVTHFACSSPQEAWYPTGPTCSIRTGARPAMSIAFSKARSWPSCRYRRRPNTRLLINLKTATALGLTVPPGLLATADEVIE